MSASVPIPPAPVPSIAPSIAIGIVTWNSAEVIEACLASVRAQSVPVTLRVLDNASADDTRTRLERQTTAEERVYVDRNLGFSAAHNRLIEATRACALYLCLNPDVVLSPDFIERMAAAFAADAKAGSASGKLLRTDGEVDTIDSTGIIMLPSQRHLDRGADQPDTGQFARPEYVFGASGAAACYRRAMLDDVKVAGEYFDEDFFAYREDADLAWRAQLLGWRCLYVPDAIARHGRRVTPERRSALPATINAWSVRNRFLLRLKNQTAGHALRFLLPTLARDLQVVGYVLLKERSSLSALGDVIRLWPRTLAKRRAIMAKRRQPTSETIAWFTHASR
jgi:GT2 family glycosyltransferase